MLAKFSTQLFPDDCRECVAASALEADILLRLFAENLLKQSGEIPADTTQILMHGLSAITVAKAARLQEKEHLLPIAEDEKQNMIVDRSSTSRLTSEPPPRAALRSPTSHRKHPTTHMNMIPTIYLLPECPFQGISKQHSARPE